MLGKTNLTAVEGGVIVSDIADYSWNAADISGVTGTFIKTLYANNILVGITADGVVVHTKDGENWEKRRLDLEDNYILNDLVWDGKRFVFVGSHTDNSTYISALVAMSENLIDYDIVTEVNMNEYFDLPSNYTNFLCVTVKDGEYNIIATYSESVGSSIFDWGYIYCVISTDLESYARKNLLFSASSGYTGRESSQKMSIFNSTTIDISKNNGMIIAYIKYLTTQSTSSSDMVLSRSSHCIYASSDGRVYDCILSKPGIQGTSNIFSVFGCKDSQYYISMSSTVDYKLVKLSEIFESSDITTGIDFGFVDAVYFDKCEVFINAHEMLVVKRGENLADKSLNDMVEITYDFSMTSIIKAFNKLYIFGTGGNILVSSAESRNEDVLSIKTMSAVKALYDAKAYTDKKIEELRAELTSGL